MDVNAVFSFIVDETRSMLTRKYPQENVARVK